MSGSPDPQAGDEARPRQPRLRRGTRAHAVLTALAAHPDGLTARDLCELAGVEPSKMKLTHYGRVLRGERARGTVVLTGVRTGTRNSSSFAYEITQAGRDALAPARPRRGRRDRARISTEEMARRYQAGETLAQVAAAAGLSESTAWRRLRKFGTEFRPRGGPRPRAAREPDAGRPDADEPDPSRAATTARVIAMYRGGATQTAIRDATGYSAPRIRGILIGAGVWQPAGIGRRRTRPLPPAGEITARYQAGESSAVLAAAYGELAQVITGIVEGSGASVRALSQAAVNYNAQLTAQERRSRVAAMRAERAARQRSPARARVHQAHIEGPRSAILAVLAASPSGATIPAVASGAGLPRSTTAGNLADLLRLGLVHRPGYRKRTGPGAPYVWEITEAGRRAAVSLGHAPPPAGCGDLAAGEGDVLWRAAADGG